MDCGLLAWHCISSPLRHCISSHIHIHKHIGTQKSFCRASKAWPGSAAFWLLNSYSRSTLGVATVQARQAEITVLVCLFQRPYLFTWRFSHCMYFIFHGLVTAPCHIAGVMWSREGHVMDDRRLLQCVRKISHTSMHNLVCAQHLMYSEVEM